MAFCLYNQNHPFIHSMIVKQIDFERTLKSSQIEAVCVVCVGGCLEESFMGKLYCPISNCS